MTDKQKNILQMTKDICRHQNVCTDVCKPISACDALRYAERAVEAGYCKRDDLKAEVAREICCKIEEEIVAALESNYRARGEQMAKDDLPYELVALINGKINALRGIEGFVEELKKKYTEGNNESQNT